MKSLEPRPAVRRIGEDEGEEEKIQYKIYAWKLAPKAQGIQELAFGLGPKELSRPRARQHPHGDNKTCCHGKVEDQNGSRLSVIHLKAKTKSRISTVATTHQNLLKACPYTPSDSVARKHFQTFAAFGCSVVGWF